MFLLAFWVCLYYMGVVYTYNSLVCLSLKSVPKPKILKLKENDTHVCH